MLLVALGVQAAYGGPVSAATSTSTATAATSATTATTTTATTTTATTTTATTTTATLAPVADTYVSSTAPEADFGLAKDLRVDGSPTDVAYLRFDLTGLAGRTLTGATLGVRVTTNASADSPTVRPVADDAWDERAVRYATRPAVGDRVLGTLGRTAPATTYTVPLDVTALQPELGGRLSIAILDLGSDGLLLGSRESGTAPVLTLTSSQSAPVTLDEVRQRAQTAPVVLAHRVGGGEIAGDNDPTGIDRLLAEGWDGVLDGGDLRQGLGDDFVPVMHDPRVDRTTLGTGLVSGYTSRAWAALELAEFPYTVPRTGTGRTAPTYAGLLSKIKSTHFFSHPEVKNASIADEVVAETRRQGMAARVVIGSFDAAALVPVRDAGIPTKLIVNERSNPGTATPANVDTLIGGTSGPTAIAYNFRSAPGEDDGWLAHQIRAGRDLEAWIVQRRVDLQTEAARVRRLGGRLTYATSDEPVYVGTSGRLRTTDRFDTQTWEHGLIRSSRSRRDPVVQAGGWLVFDDAAQAQWSLLGALSGPVAPRHVELDVRWDALDATPSAAVGLFYNQATDKPMHYGIAGAPAPSAGLQGSGYLFLFQQDGQLRLVRPGDGGALTALGPAVTSPAVRAGQVVRVRVGVTADGKPFATRLDTGVTVTATAADTTYRGGYWSVGKSGWSGSRFGVADVVVTP